MGKQAGSRLFALSGNSGAVRLRQTRRRHSGEENARAERYRAQPQLCVPLKKQRRSSQLDSCLNSDTELRALSTHREDHPNDITYYQHAL